MEFSDAEPCAPIMEHIFTGLKKHGLVDNGYKVVSSNPPFRFFHPTLAGIELFLWGVGVGDRGFEAYKPTLLKGADLPNSIQPLDVRLDKVGWD
jgi:hypothetical protein